MQLVLNPSQFDVILIGNLFGDIFPTEGFLHHRFRRHAAFASLSDTKLGMYEPIRQRAGIAGTEYREPHR